MVVCVCVCRQTVDGTPIVAGLVLLGGKGKFTSLSLSTFILPLVIKKDLKKFIFLIIHSEKFYNTFLCLRSDKSLIKKKKKIGKRTSIIILFCSIFPFPLFVLCLFNFENLSFVLSEETGWF